MIVPVLVFIVLAAHIVLAYFVVWTGMRAREVRLIFKIGMMAFATILTVAIAADVRLAVYIHYNCNPQHPCGGL